MRRAFSLLAIGVVALGAIAIRETKLNSAEPPHRLLRHLVLYRFKDSIDQQKVAEVVAAFADLPKQVPTIVGFEHGPNVSAEGKSDGLTYAFVVSFRDEKGRDEYLAHPAHQKYVELVRDRREKVIVFDYWTRD